MYMNEHGEIFFEPLPGNKSFRDETFEVDTMIAPVVAELIKKGYITRASCEGHVFTHMVSNVEACCDNMDEKYISHREEGFSSPYIMIEDDIAFPSDYPIPKTWILEVNTPRSSAFDDLLEGESDEELYTWLYTSEDGIPYLNYERGFNIVFRIADNVFGENANFYDEDYVLEFFNSCKDDPYETVYIPIMNAIHDLYLWAKSLPEYEKK